MAEHWESPDYGPNSELTKVIQALASADPTGTLRDLYPWMPEERCDVFVATAVPLQNAGNVAALQVAAERFVHQVWAAKRYPPNLSWFARLRARFRPRSGTD